MLWLEYTPVLCAEWCFQSNVTRTVQAVFTIFLHLRSKVCQCICMHGWNNNSKNVIVQIKVGSAQEKSSIHQYRFRLDFDTFFWKWDYEKWLQISWKGVYNSFYMHWLFEFRNLLIQFDIFGTILHWLHISSKQEHPSAFESSPTI